MRPYSGAYITGTKNTLARHQQMLLNRDAKITGRL
jgi:hypothetical protein